MRFLTGEEGRLRLKNHFRYCWWKYLVAWSAGLLLLYILFDMTRYRPPVDRSIELYMLNGYTRTEALQEDLWPALQKRCPDQEELQVVNIDLLQDEMYSRMQYATYLASQQGDVMLMPMVEVERIMQGSGAEEVFVDLEPYVREGILRVDALDVTPGMLLRSDGTRGLYGIPADSLTGLSEFRTKPEGALLVAMKYGGNLDTSVRLIELMLERYGR